MEECVVYVVGSFMAIDLQRGTKHFIVVDLRKGNFKNTKNRFYSLSMLVGVVWVDFFR